METKKICVIFPEAINRLNRCMQRQEKISSTRKDWCQDKDFGQQSEAKNQKALGLAKCLEKVKICIPFQWEESRKGNYISCQKISSTRKDWCQDKDFGQQPEVKAKKRNQKVLGIAKFLE